MIARGHVRASLAVLILLVGAFAAACGGDDDGDNGNANDDDPAAVEAQRIFVEVGCAECHGERGEGDGENRRTEITGTRMIRGQFQTRVRNGRGAAMPGFNEEQITDEQIELLWEWLRQS